MPEREVAYALLLRANKPETAVQSSHLFSLGITSHGLILSWNKCVSGAGEFCFLSTGLSFKASDVMTFE